MVGDRDKLLCRLIIANGNKIETISRWDIRFGSQDDASWMYEFSPMVFPSRMKSHLDPCRSISSNKKDMGSKRRKWGMGKRCEYSMEGGVFFVWGGWEPRDVLSLVELVLENDDQQNIEEYILIKTLFCVQLYSSGKRKWSHSYIVTSII